MSLTGANVGAVPFDESKNPTDETGSTPLILQEVLVHKGETIAAGTTLAVLADYSELYIQGKMCIRDSAGTE